MGDETVRLTLDLDPDFQKRLKTTAALKGITMRRYCIEAIQDKLSKDARSGMTEGKLTEEAVARLAALQDEIFRSGALPGDSTELIREARSARAKRI